MRGVTRIIFGCIYLFFLGVSVGFIINGAEIKIQSIIITVIFCAFLMISGVNKLKNEE